mgnify:FL=1
MSMTNYERVGKAMELLREGLAPYVEREVHDKIRNNAVRMDTLRRYAEDENLGKLSIAEYDVAALLKLMMETWNDVFRVILGNAERNLVFELKEWRNRWAHQKTITSEDALRALDSAVRLLNAIMALPQAEELARLKMELTRQVFDEQVRSEKRKVGGSLVEAAASAGLKPWREVATPHADVASGKYQQAEFAADLWQVHLGQGANEYRDPKEFFRRTYLTTSLLRLLTGGISRLCGTGGDPVVQLQTNFGGGKTHSMLALYHLFSGVAPGELSGADAVLAAAGTDRVPVARRVVLVGNRISPGNPVIKPDGTEVRTIWEIGRASCRERV